jgi:hypothetical protein
MDGIRPCGRALSPSSSALPTLRVELPLFETRDLAIYASIVGTVNGAWTLYHGVIRDRARIDLAVAEAEDMNRPGQYALMFRISNRGRRDLPVDQITRWSNVWRGKYLWIEDLETLVANKRVIAADDGHTYVLRIGANKVDLPTRRWFVIAGAGRIYPLRMRYLLRLIAFVL